MRRKHVRCAQVFKHPWLSAGTMPSPGDIRAEMASRAPAHREIGTRQLVNLLPDPKQWTSLGELRRTLRMGGVSPFPRDTELRQAVLSCGRASGGGDYCATRTFVMLTTFLTSLGMQPRKFSSRLLRFTGCTSDSGAPSSALVDQLDVQASPCLPLVD